MVTVFGSLVSRLHKGQATNSTTANFAVADTRPTTTVPAGSATRTVIATGAGLAVKDMVTLKVLPFGGDANNDVINLKVIGWARVTPQIANVPDNQFISRHVCEVSCTLSSSLPGIAGFPVVATELFADTLTLTTGIAVLHQGTADVDMAWFECDVSSYQFVEILYSMGSGGDRANCLYGW